MMLHPPMFFDVPFPYPLSFTHEYLWTLSFQQALSIARCHHCTDLCNVMLASHDVGESHWMRKEKAIHSTIKIRFVLVEKRTKQRARRRNSLSHCMPAFGYEPIMVKSESPWIIRWAYPAGRSKASPTCNDMVVQDSEEIFLFFGLARSSVPPRSIVAEEEITISNSWVV